MSTNTPSSTNGKSLGVAYALWFFLGGFGAHRFYAGRTGSAIGMTALTVGSFITSFILIGFVGFAALAAWWIFDAIKMQDLLEPTPQRSEGAGHSLPHAVKPGQPASSESPLDHYSAAA